jgi:hypothetical protein
MAMLPILNTDDPVRPIIFAVNVREEAGSWLKGYGGYLEGFWGPDDRFVFVRPE